MAHKDETPLPFNCGVCAKSLTDCSTLITSCGHLFCTTPTSRCTQLSVSSPAGKCEQCGKQCDAGTLANRAAGQNDRVKSFIFKDLHELLVDTAEIIRFRETHRHILSDNVTKKEKLIERLRTEVQSMREMNGMPISTRTANYSGQLDSLRRQCEKLRRGSEQLLRDNERVRSERSDLRKRTEMLLVDNAALRKKLKRLEGPVATKPIPRDATKTPMATSVYAADDGHNNDGGISAKPDGIDLRPGYDMHGQQTTGLSRSRIGIGRTARLTSWVHRTAPVGSRIFRARRGQPRYSSHRFLTPGVGHAPNATAMSGPHRGAEPMDDGHGESRRLAGQKRVAEHSHRI